MSLRRFAQANAAIASPRASIGGKAEMASPRSPVSPTQASGSLPTTPRTRISYPITPSSTSSLSASRPFDWEAARAQRPPPYATPLQGARLRALRNSVGGAKASPRRLIRKKGIVERITSIPSNVMFELSLFPHNVPLPAPATSARLLGGLMHLAHFSVRVSRLRSIPDDELNWEDLYNESRGASWFDWTLPITFILIVCSFLNTLKLFTSIKLYNLHLRRDLVSSPHASVVNTELDFSPMEPPPLTKRFASWLSYKFSASWRYLLNAKPPAPRVNSGRTERVQQLSVWAPGELELELFTVYSPVHAFIWFALNGSNWILMFSIMAIASAQTHLLTSSYKALIKDKEIIAAEVMHEYDEKFVNPRIHPVRRDAAVMTHQAEVVNIWED